MGMSSPLLVQQPALLQAFLFEKHPNLKKIKVRQWLKYEAVVVNNRVVTRWDHPLKPGDRVMIRTRREVQTEKILPRGMRIRFEDETLIVIEKPPEMLSIASKAERDETAYIHLTDYVRGGDPRGHERIWIVHRLDKETSGLMVFARTIEAKHEMQDNWERFDKRYYAVVEGEPPEDSGTIVSHLDESNPYRVLIARRSEETRRAVTHYRVLRKGQGRTLVELKLETGRRHQIRVQLSSLGCPIIGDEKYGATTDPAKRLGLHAYRLRFPHPVTRQEVEVECPLPRELDRLV